MKRDVATHEVRGVDVDSETRCEHYDSPRDVVALRFGCCRPFYSCYECHDAVTDHDSEPWPRDRFDEAAVLCGACGTTLTVVEYLDADDECPSCDAAFNPGCRNHYDHYFDGL